MKVFTKSSTFVFALCMLLFVACQKDETVSKSSVQNSSTSPQQLSITADLAKEYPVMVAPEEYPSFEEVQFMAIPNATVINSDGTTLSGDLKVSTFLQHDGTSFQVVELDGELVYGEIAQFQVKETQVIHTNRRMMTISMICGAVAAVAYQTEYNRILRENNVLCDFCAYAVADKAFRECMGAS